MFIKRPNRAAGSWALIPAFAPVVLFTIVFSYVTADIMDGLRAVAVASGQYYRLWGDLELAVERCANFGDAATCSGYQSYLKRALALQNSRTEMLQPHPDLKKATAYLEQGGLVAVDASRVVSFFHRYYFLTPQKRITGNSQVTRDALTRIGEIASEVEAQAKSGHPDAAKLRALLAEATALRDAFYARADMATEQSAVIARDTELSLIFIVCFGTIMLSGFGAYSFRRILLKLESTHHELIEREDLLHQTAKLESIGALAGGVAHDFNNILMIISSYAQMIRDRIAPGTPEDAHLKAILSASERGGSLTQQLLAFSRKQAIEPRVVSFVALIPDSVLLIRRLVGENVQIKTQIAHSVHAIKADPNQVSQILLNLAANARDAMPSGGELRVGVQNTVVNGKHRHLHPQVLPGDYVLVTMSDTGEGIPESIRSRIFEPFFTTKPKGKGTGLGLATVYGIMKQCGGFVEVASEVGKGTTFSLYFPRTQYTGPVASATAVGDLRGYGHVLLVEDEEGIRDTLSEFLQECGYEVLIARDGREAVEIALGQKLDAIVTDVVLPSLSGPEVVAVLKRDRPDIKVLYVSGYVEDFANRIGPQTPFMQKPFHMRDLALKLKEVMATPVGSVERA